MQQLREMATMSTMAARMTVQPQRGARNGTRARSPRPCLRLRMNSSSAPLRVTLMEAQRWTRTWLGKDAGMWPGNAARASITKLNLLAPRATGSGLPAHGLPPWRRISISAWITIASQALRTWTPSTVHSHRPTAPPPRLLQGGVVALPPRADRMGFLCALELGLGVGDHKGALIPEVAVGAQQDVSPGVEVVWLLEDEGGRS